MADISCKIEKGPNGGYISLIKVTSPVLGTRSGQWFKVHPDGTDDGFEYPMAVTAENAARRKAIQLLEQVNLKELAAGIIKNPHKSMDKKAREKWDKYLMEQSHRVLKEHARRNREGKDSF
jgi:hypothetical protein